MLMAEKMSETFVNRRKRLLKILKNMRSTKTQKIFNKYKVKKKPQDLKSIAIKIY